MPELMAGAIQDCLPMSDKPVIAYVSPHAPEVGRAADAARRAGLCRGRELHRGAGRDAQDQPLRSARRDARPQVPSPWRWTTSRRVRWTRPRPSSCSPLRRALRGRGHRHHTGRGRSRGARAGWPCGAEDPVLADHAQERRRRRGRGPDARDRGRAPDADGRRCRSQGGRAARSASSCRKWSAAARS